MENEIKILQDSGKEITPTSMEFNEEIKLVQYYASSLEYNVISGEGLVTIRQHRLPGIEAGYIKISLSKEKINILVKTNYLKILVQTFHTQTQKVEIWQINIINLTIINPTGGFANVKDKG